MMAETKTNEGQIQAAVEFARSAEQLINQAMEDELDIRVHLRTGRLSTALDSLRRRVDQESRSSRPSRSHRETQLLLSLYILAHRRRRQGPQVRRGGNSPRARPQGPVRGGCGLYASWACMPHKPFTGRS